MPTDRDEKRKCPRCKSDDLAYTGRPSSGGAQILMDGQKYQFFKDVRCCRCGHVFGIPVD